MNYSNLYKAFLTSNLYNRIFWDIKKLFTTSIMSLTKAARFENNLVNIKQKGIALVKIVDELRTAQDLLPYPNPVDPNVMLPGQGRTIYGSIYMTFSGTFINATKDIRVWTDASNQNINNLNSVLEIPGNTNLIYEVQTGDEVIGRFAPFETDPGADPNALQDLGNNPDGTPLIAPPALSYGFLPRTISDSTYDYNAGGWMTGLPLEVNGQPYYDPNTAYFGDDDAQDIIVVGQTPNGSGGFVSREILEIVNVRTIAVGVGAEQKPGIPANFESVVIAIANADTRFAGINSIPEWQAAAAAAAAGGDSFLLVTLGTVRQFVRTLLSWPTFTWTNFKDLTYSNDLIRFQHARFLAQE